MLEDEILVSKYARLCVEFKKLREKNKMLKDSARKYIENIDLIEEKRIFQDIHLHNLEQEKESLLFRNQCLMSQLVTLQSDIDTFPKNNASQSSVENIFNKLMDECNLLHTQLASQSEKFILRIASIEKKMNDSLSINSTTVGKSKLNTKNVSIGVQTSQTSVQTRRESSTECGLTLPCSIVEDKMSNSLSSEYSKRFVLPNSLFGVDSQCSNEISHQITIPHKLNSDRKLRMARSNSSPDCLYSANTRRTKIDIFSRDYEETSERETSIRENLLLLRINQLEHRLVENSLRHSVDLRRSQLARKSLVISSISSCPQTSEITSVSSSSEFGISGIGSDCTDCTYADLLAKEYDSQLASCNQRLLIYAGRAAAAHEEIRNQNAHLKAALLELEIQKQSTEAAQRKIIELETELESTKLRTAQQLSEMAMHMANLSDDVNYLRSGSLDWNEALKKKADFSNSGFMRSSTNNQDKLASFFGSFLH